MIINHMDGICTILQTGCQTSDDEAVELLNIIDTKQAAEICGSFNHCPNSQKHGITAAADVTGSFKLMIRSTTLVAHSHRCFHSF